MAIRTGSVLAAPAQTPEPSPSCPNAHDLCQIIYDKTGLSWLAEGSYLFLVKPLRILLIVALAVLARAIIHRTINRLVRTTTSESSPALLQPLREKVPGALLRDATGVLPERRRQRAEALGSVLRSVASAAIFVVALMLVLGELSINLAPLLASAGIVGLAIGFGAQNLVKDFVAGMFMLLEDQYGVGDVVDVGQASGTVEAVGLRITTIRDAQGVVWYIRNGEIVRVGNKSQGWAQVVVDIPVGFAGVQEATEILRAAATRLADDPQWGEDLIGEPEVLGVEQITADGAVLRTTVKTTSESQWRVGRELRRRLTDALDEAGIAERLGAGRVLLHPASSTGVEVGPAGSVGPVAPAGSAGPVEPATPGPADASGHTKGNGGYLADSGLGGAP
ncbi:mechanosensitive ion channel family protein [Planosporangium sp. 12N6]|uniref:mechanosensitive ion channel family protein n=1 Tax=Planosporangium spinosum TaxID=3402278 RepID=UPI003CF9A904